MGHRNQENKKILTNEFLVSSLLVVSRETGPRGAPTAPTPTRSRLRGPESPRPRSLTHTLQGGELSQEVATVAGDVVATRRVSVGSLAPLRLPPPVGVSPTA